MGTPLKRFIARVEGREIDYCRPVLRAPSTGMYNVSVSATTGGMAAVYFDALDELDAFVELNRMLENEAILAAIERVQDPNRWNGIGHFVWNHHSTTTDA